MVKTYTAADLVGQLLAAGGPVMLWVGVGISGGLVLLFLFLAIRSGIRFFRSLAGDRGSAIWADGRDVWDHDDPRWNR